MKVFTFFENYFWHTIVALQFILIIYMLIIKAPKIDIISNNVFFVLAIVMMQDSKNQKLEARVKVLEESNKPYEDGEV